MIRYTLRCDQGHTFDSWFQSSEAYDRLDGLGRLSCAVCGGDRIAKAVMAPRIAAPEHAGPAPEVAARIAALKARVAAAEDVGENFAREARAIHEGRSPDRPIVGAASLGEARALVEDDIPVSPVPPGWRRAN